MATALDQLKGISGIVNAVTGLTGKSQSQTTSGTSKQTSKTNISDEGINRVLQQILAGPGGIKDISGAARGAGLYNSTTETQLLNDLSARAAGEAERLRAGTETTTTTSQTTDINQPGLFSNLGQAGLALLAPSAIGAAGKGIGSLISGLGGASASAAPLGNVLASSGLDLGANLLGGVDAASVGNTILGGLTGSTVDLGASLGTSLADFTPSFGAALGAVPFGNVLSGLLGGGIMNDESGLGLLSAIGTGALAGGPLGALAAPLASVFGGALGDLSIVCTALQARGLLNKVKYDAGQSYLQSLNYYTKQGYYALFSGVADKIARGSKFWTAVCLPFARSRTELIWQGTQGVGWTRWLRNPLGTITKVIGEPICYAVGRVRS